MVLYLFVTLDAGNPPRRPSIVHRNGSLKIATATFRARSTARLANNMCRWSQAFDYADAKRGTYLFLIVARRERGRARRRSRD